MPILRQHAASHKSLEASHYNKGALADSSDFGLLGGAKFTKMGDSLPWTPMNRRAKFDAVRFSLVREIRNRTNTQKTYKRTKSMGSNIYIINVNGH